jgi:hypothetical protein
MYGEAVFYKYMYVLTTRSDTHMLRHVIFSRVFLAICVLQIKHVISKVE